MLKHPLPLARNLDALKDEWTESAAPTPQFDHPLKREYPFLQQQKDLERSNIQQRDSNSSRP
jgi:hypothetical protein